MRGGAVRVVPHVGVHAELQEAADALSRARAAHQCIAEFPANLSDALSPTLLRTAQGAIAALRPRRRQAADDDDDDIYGDNSVAAPAAAAKPKAVAEPLASVRATRAAAYELLLAVAEGGGGFAGPLLSALRPIHSPLAGEAARWAEVWDIDADGEAAADDGYVGVVNLGCTCYMASLVQQLFMLTGFRRGVMAAAGKGDHLPMLKELQQMFALLQARRAQFCAIPAQTLRNSLTSVSHLQASRRRAIARRRSVLRSATLTAAASSRTNNGTPRSSSTNSFNASKRRVASSYSMSTSAEPSPSRCYGTVTTDSSIATPTVLNRSASYLWR